MTPKLRLTLQAYEVGNLTLDARFTHYDLKASTNVKDVPVFVNTGRMVATDTFTSFAVSLRNMGALLLRGSTTFQLNYGGSFARNSSVDVAAPCELMLLGGAQLAWAGNISGQGEVQVAAGTHTMPGVIRASAMHVNIAQGAAVR